MCSLKKQLCFYVNMHYFPQRRQELFILGHQCGRFEKKVFFYVLLTVHLGIILAINQLNAQNRLL